MLKLISTSIGQNPKFFYDCVEEGCSASLPKATDDRLYQMNHCVSIPIIFVSAIFASLSRQMTRATLTTKMALTAKMGDC